MVSFGTRMKWKSGLCPHIIHPCIHPSIYLGWCAGGSGGGRCWFPSLAMLRSYTVNSHVVGRNLNLFDPQKAFRKIIWVSRYAPSFWALQTMPKKPGWFPMAKYDLDDNTHMSPLGHKCQSRLTIITIKLTLYQMSFCRAWCNAEKGVLVCLKFLHIV